MTIQEYIDGQEQIIRPRLNAIYDTIRAAIPSAEEARSCATGLSPPLWIPPVSVASGYPNCSFRNLSPLRKCKKAPTSIRRHG